MKTTVYLPDELAARLEKKKDRFNISNICQQAINAELLALESVDTDGLKAARKKSNLRWFAEGKADGMKAALNCKDYDLLLETQALFESYQGDRIYSLPEQLLDAIEEPWELAKGIMDIWNFGPDDFFNMGTIINKDAFTVGWCFGVSEAINTFTE